MTALRDDVLTGAKAIAQETGLKVKTVYLLAARGDLPAFKIGGMLCARRSELRERLTAKVG